MRVRHCSVARGDLLQFLITAGLFLMIVPNGMVHADQLIINCPGNMPGVRAGDTIRWNVTASGGNGSPLRFFMPTTGPEQFSVDSISGVVSYVASWSDFGFGRCDTVGVTDGADSVLCQVCYLLIDGPGNRILIEPKNFVEIGSTIDVRIFMVSMLGSVGFGGFDFLISPGNPALAILSASPGTLYDSCGWEYFTYRFGEHDTCTGCPSGLIHITGLAETNPLTPHPTGGLQWQDFPFPLTLATLKIRVSYDPALYCEILPIRFFWTDCDDNTVWSKSGVRKDIAMAHRIYDYGNPESIWDPNAGVPGYLGVPPSCYYDSVTAGRFHDMELKNSGIEIQCIEPVGQRGDINVNGFPNEIADAVMFSEYFVVGLTAFQSHIDASIAASDINDDGLILSLPDLIYLLRVILGDTPPIPKPVASQFAAVTSGGGIVAVHDSPNLGAAWFTFRGDVAVASVNPELRMLRHLDGTTTSVLLTIPFSENYTGTGFSGELLRVDNAEILRAELVDFDGQLVTAKFDIPLNFVLDQNYPNPFNNATIVSFTLPIDGAYTLSVFNVGGQLVMKRDGEAQKLNPVSISLDMSGMASGMYLYKLESAGMSATRKMLLLK